MDELTKCFGIGPVKAKNLIEIHKIKTIEELRKAYSKDEKLLTSSQKIGLEYYEDFLERIPRSEMLKHKKVLNLKKSQGEIVGSFRRGLSDSGDIDVMLNMNIGEFKIFICKLQKKGYITDILAQGDKKMLGLCRLKDGKYRRIDIIRNTPEEYPYMLLYFTGSMEFNIAFRQHCLSLGISLSEHGFKPEIYGLKTEKDIFKFVNLEYVRPDERIDDSVIKKINYYHYK